MSIFAKNKSIIRRTLAEERLPNVVSRTITFMHQASSFVGFIDLNNLTVPTDAASEGFANPGASVFPYLRLYRQNITVESSFKGKLQDYVDYRIVNNEKIQLINLTTEPGEIFIIKLVLPNNIDTKNLLDELSSPVNMYNNAKYGVANVPSKVKDMLSPVITDILTHVSTQNRKRFESVGDVYSTLSVSLPGSYTFNSGVLLQDGRVFLVPFNTNTARIFDPVTNTVTTLTTPTFSSAADSLSGGVLMADGKVFLIPRGATTAYIYDPMNNSVSTVGSLSSNPHKFIGGVLLPDGRVFLVPGSSQYPAIYNPTTGSLTVLTYHTFHTTSYGFSGGVLLPNGKVFCVPFDSQQAKVYDPVADSVFTPPTNFHTGTQGFSGGILLPDGRVFCVPHNSQQAKIYNPTDYSVYTPLHTFHTGTNGFTGGVLLPDGRVFCTPYNANVIKIYDPVTGNVITPPITFSGTEKFSGSILLPDGRVFMVPYNHTSGVIISGNFSRFINDFQYPKEILLSPFFNKY
jgi:outer membrane protein assembly factor BamB